MAEWWRASIRQSHFARPQLIEVSKGYCRLKTRLGNTPQSPWVPTLLLHAKTEIDSNDRQSGSL